VRVLRIYHSAVVSEYRWRERLLQRDYHHEMHTVLPPVWEEGGRRVRAELEPGLHLHVVDVHGSAKPNLFWYSPSQLRKVIRHVRPELVDLHEEPFSLAAASVLWALDRERIHPPFCVYSAQNLVERRYPSPFSDIERAVLARARGAFPCVSEAGDRLRSRGFTGALRVIPLGVNVVSAERLEARFAEESANGSLRMHVGFISRLEHYKGGAIALSAFAAACRQIPSLTMEVIGDGSEMLALQRQADDLGVGHRVDFCGALSQEETLQRLNAFQVVLVPSLTTRTWKEQYGRVAAQALAHGVAVIASDSGSLAEVLGHAGVLVPEGDASAMAHRLVRLAGDRHALTDLRRRGRERAERDLSWSAVARNADALYQELLQ
jgi:glycosyltransferase involved in cell wall biosynthesis